MTKKYVSVEDLLNEFSYGTEEGEKLDYETIDILMKYMPASAFIEREVVEDAPFFAAAIEKVAAERQSQIDKWGADTDNSPFEWMSILGEEFGELCEAINETFFGNPTHPELGGIEKIITEASQVAAVAVAIIESASAPYKEG